MPIIRTSDTKSLRGRLMIVGIYAALIVGGLTMVYPFMVMLTGSISTPFDFDRRSPIPRFLFSRSDRFMRMLCGFFPPSHRGSFAQLRSFFPDLPSDWQIWAQVGDETGATDRWARQQLATLEDPAIREQLGTVAQDYLDFTRDWDLRETVLAYDQRHVTPFLRDKYGTLDAFNVAWEMSVDDFTKVQAAEWSGEPIDQAAYVPLVDRRYLDLLEFRQAHRESRFSTYLRGERAPAGFLRPAALAYLWEAAAAKALGSEAPRAPKQLPFPVPPDANPELRRAWREFLGTKFPIRHIQIAVTPTRQKQFEAFLKERFRNLEYMNRLMAEDDPDWVALAAWREAALTPTVPDGPMGKVWIDSVRSQIPVAEWTLRDTLPEKAFQQFALKRHGSLGALNHAYGQSLTRIEELRLPFRAAALITFRNRQWALTWHQILASYVAVFDYLFRRGRAVSNTIILVGLTIFINLTVNPLAGYALSRFRLRQTEKIIVFCLATTAFPAAVAAIPGFLLLRDLGLLNTFAALVLPGAANGMTIFLLKGFFDSLPQELYEAATIDGASEVQIFYRVSLPLVKPILAVSALNAFILAYNGWAWAIIVCQDPKMWTVAVWTYQFYQNMGAQPYTVMAAFMINSIPVLLVFLFCQKIILRGIILPTMK